MKYVGKDEKDEKWVCMPGTMKDFCHKIDNTKIYHQDGKDYCMCKDDSMKVELKKDKKDWNNPYDVECRSQTTGECHGEEVWFKDSNKCMHYKSCRGDFGIWLIDKNGKHVTL